MQATRARKLDENDERAQEKHEEANQGPLTDGSLQPRWWLSRDPAAFMVMPSVGRLRPLPENARRTNGGFKVLATADVIEASFELTRYDPVPDDRPPYLPVVGAAIAGFRC